MKPEHCPHPARALTNPRRLDCTGGPDKVWVADCRLCKDAVRLDSEAGQYPRKHLGDSLERHGGARDGGPEVGSVMGEQPTALPFRLSTN